MGVEHHTLKNTRLKGLAISWFFAPYIGSADLDFFKRIKNCRADFDVVQVARDARDEHVLQFGGAATINRIEVETDHLNPRSRRTRDDFRDAALKVFEANADSYDFVISHSNEVPSHAIALAIKKRRPALPWIAYFGDVVSANPYVQLIANYPLHDEDCETEAQTLTHADLVICNNAQQRDLMFSGPLEMFRSKALVIPHAFDPAMFPKRPPPNNDRHHFAHIGTLYHAKRVASPVLRAVDRLIELHPEYRHRFDVTFVGNGFYPVDLKTSEQLTHGDHVRIEGPVSYLQSLELMQQADTLLNIDAVFPPSDAMPQSPFFPGKLADYMGAGRPMVSVTMERGPTADVMRASGNRFCDDQVDNIVVALKQCIDAPSPLSPVYARYSTDIVGREMDAAIRDGIAWASRPPPSTTPAAEAPMLTVLLRADDDAVCIERCLASLQRQTLASLEVVVLDDGSAGAAHAVAERDARFKVLDVSNDAETAETLGVQHASGKYLLALDADDCLEPDEAWSLVQAAESNAADLVVSADDPTIGSARVLDETGRAAALGTVFRRRRWLFLRSRVAQGALKLPPRQLQTSDAAPRAVLVASRLVEVPRVGVYEHIKPRKCSGDVHVTTGLLRSLLQTRSQSASPAIERALIDLSLALVLPLVAATRDTTPEARTTRLRTLFSPLDTAFGRRWLGAPLRAALGARRAALVRAARILDYAPLVWSWQLEDEDLTLDAPLERRLPPAALSKYQQLKDRVQRALARRLSY